MDIIKELGVNSIKEKVREMRLRWYGHMQLLIISTNALTSLYIMIVPGKRPRGRPRGRWMDCVRRDHPGERPGQNILEISQEFWPLTSPSGKRRRRRSHICIKSYYTIHRVYRMFSRVISSAILKKTYRTKTPPVVLFINNNIIADKHCSHI